MASASRMDFHKTWRQYDTFFRKLGFRVRRLAFWNPVFPGFLYFLHFLYFYNSWKSGPGNRQESPKGCTTPPRGPKTPPRDAEEAPRRLQEALILGDLGLSLRPDSQTCPEYTPEEPRIANQHAFGGIFQSVIFTYKKEFVKQFNK